MQAESIHAVQAESIPSANTRVSQRGSASTGRVADVCRVLHSNLHTESSLF